MAARRGDLAAQATLRADLRALADRGALPPRCARVAASNHKLIPLLALWTGRAPASFSGAGAAEAYVEPATAAAQRTLLARLERSAGGGAGTAGRGCRGRAQRRLARRGAGADRR